MPSSPFGCMSSCTATSPMCSCVWRYTAMFCCVYLVYLCICLSIICVTFDLYMCLSLSLCLTFFGELGLRSINLCVSFSCLFASLCQNVFLPVIHVSPVYMVADISVSTCVYASLTIFLSDFMFSCLACLSISKNAVSLTADINH